MLDLIYDYLKKVIPKDVYKEAKGKRLIGGSLKKVETTATVT